MLTQVESPDHVPFNLIRHNALSLSGDSGVGVGVGAGAGAVVAGHACVLQAWVSSNTGHAVPPWAAGVLTVLVRVRLPPPHVLLQAPNAP